MSQQKVWFITGSSRRFGRALTGVAAFEMSQRYSRAQLLEAQAWERVSRSADFGQPFPAELPPDAPPT